MRHAQDLGSRSPQPVHAPVGTVIMYAGSVEDLASPMGPLRRQLCGNGWLVCDGVALPICNADNSPSIYLPLFHVIGTTYGGSGNVFNLPDYRGYFFRGRDFDNGNNPEGPYKPRDPDGQERTPSSPQLKPTGVGSTQDTVVQSHGHDYNHLAKPKPPQVATLVTQGEGPPALIAEASCATDYGKPDAWVGKTFSETRPINISINLLIKFVDTVGKPAPALSHLMGLHPAELSLAELTQRRRQRPRK